MEFDPAIIKCPKCSEALSLFFQKGVSAQGYAQVDAELKGKVNEIIKSMSQVARELEDMQARLLRVEEYLQAPQKTQPY